MKKKAGLISLFVILLLTIFQQIAYAAEGIYINWYFCTGNSFGEIYSCLKWAIIHIFS